MDRRPAVHRTIVIADVEGFGNRQRTNQHQVAIRDGLYRVMRDAFGRAGIPWDRCDREDRGDGVFILVPADVPKSLFVESLPSALVATLRGNNATCASEQRIRLRMALHAGEVNYDDHGVTAMSINLAFRLVEAGALKTALAGSTGVLAVIASSWFFDEVVQHSAAASAYHRVALTVKETSTTGWICLPDYSGGHQVPIDLPPDTALSAMPLTVLHTLPRDQAAFTGRIRELDQILSITGADAGSVGIYAVDGMAGIGKTALAVHAARRLAARFPDGQIFIRLHAHTEGQRPVDPAEALATLLLWTGAAPQQIPPGLDARAAAWRHQLTGKKMLLVLDDAIGSDQVGPLLPGSANCLVLVTSRRRLTALEEAVPISLDTLPHADAAELFARFAGRRDIQPSNDAIAEIVALCGYLPLAIRLVAAGLRHHPSWTVTGVATELSASHDRLTAMRAENISVTAAFDLSYRDLTTSQQRLFRRLGLHPGNDVDAYAAAALDDADLQVTRQHLGDLHDHNLVSEPTRGRYLLHELLREHARTLAASCDCGQDNAAIDRLLDYYLHAAVAAGRHLAWRTATVGPTLQGRPPAWAPELRTAEEAIAWLNTERVNLRRCAEHAAASGRLEHAIRIPAAIGDFLHAQGHWNEALTLHQLALATARTAGDRAGQAGAFHSLGTMQRLTGDSAAAMTSQTLAVELFRDLGDRQGQARALNQLGIVQRHTGDNTAGAISHSRALELFRDLGDRQGQARALNSLGVMQQTLGDYEASANSERQALSLFCEVGDQDGQARALNFLGVAQQLAGDYPAAGISLTHALDLFREIGDRLGQADALINLGALLYRTSDFQDANHHYTEALHISREVNAPFQEARALEGIGLCRIREGTSGEGAARLRQALAIYQRIGAPEAGRTEKILLSEGSLPGNYLLSTSQDDACKPPLAAESPAPRAEPKT